MHGGGLGAFCSWGCVGGGVVCREGLNWVHVGWRDSGGSCVCTGVASRCCWLCGA